MGWSAFGLVRRPFRPWPDPSSYVPVPGHESTLHDLRDAYDSEDDGVLLSGDAGTGKTMIVHRFLDSLPDDVPKMLLPAAKYSRPNDLFQAIAFDLGRPWQGKSESELRLEMTDHFLHELGHGQTTVVVIDDAHFVSVEVIDELRLLGNLISSDRRATFCLLAGLPSLIDRLNTPWLSATAERFRVKPKLQPLSTDEMNAYLWQQLEHAGARDPERILDDESARLIGTIALGYPRRMNHIAATAMSLAVSAESDTIDCEAILEAADRLGYAVPADESQQSLQAEESPPLTLSIPPAAREPAASRSPKVRPARRQSA